MDRCRRLQNARATKWLETLAKKQGLADAVLDRAVDFADVKMKGGGQKFFERLGKLMEQPSAPKRIRPVSVAEKPAAFAERLAEELGESLLSCEERTVRGRKKIHIVVDGNPEQLKARTIAVCVDVFGAGQDIEILDRQTAEALHRLIDSGLMQTAGKSRPLYPVPEPLQLSDETKARVAELKAKADRTLSMACLLIENGFPAGALAPVQEVVRQRTLSRVLEKGLSETQITDELLSGEWDAPVADFMKAPTTGQVSEIIESLKTRCDA